jgi:hypothetical protein
MVVEGVLDLEAEAEADLEVVGVVEDVTASELEDWTEEMLDCTGTLDDWEGDADETGAEEADESAACELEGSGSGILSLWLPPPLPLPRPCRAKRAWCAELR